MYDHTNILEYAALGGRLDVVRLLISEHGMDPGEVDECGEDLLYKAVEWHLVSVVAVLCTEFKDDINPNFYTTMNWAAHKPEESVLHTAVWGGEQNIVQCLLECGADPTGRDQIGYTARECAVMDKRDNIRDLLQENEMGRGDKRRSDGEGAEEAAVAKRLCVR